MNLRAADSYSQIFAISFAAIESRWLRRRRKRSTNHDKVIVRSPSTPAFCSSQLPTCQTLTPCTSTRWHGLLTCTSCQFKRGMFCQIMYSV